MTPQSNLPKSSGDFEQDVRDGYYRKLRVVSPNASTFGDDFNNWLRKHGVPEQYVGKVSYYCYERGHAHGEESILNVAYGIVEIFA